MRRICVAHASQPQSFQPQKILANEIVLLDVGQSARGIAAFSRDELNEVPLVVRMDKNDGKLVHGKGRRLVGIAHERFASYLQGTESAHRTTC